MLDYGCAIFQHRLVIVKIIHILTISEPVLPMAKRLDRSDHPIKKPHLAVKLFYWRAIWDSNPGHSA